MRFAIVFIVELSHLALIFSVQRISDTRVECIPLLETFLDRSDDILEGARLVGSLTDFIQFRWSNQAGALTIEIS